MISVVPCITAAAVKDDVVPKEEKAKKCLALKTAPSITDYGCNDSKRRAKHEESTQPLKPKDAFDSRDVYLL